MSYQVPQHIDKNKIFIVKRSEIEGRLDPSIYKDSFTFTSKIYTNKSGINVQYVKELIKSSIGQLSLNRLKRPIARANINLEEISTIKIPLPPLTKQQEIADHITTLRHQAARLQQEGKEALERAKQEVEQMILGK